MGKVHESPLDVRCVNMNLMAECAPILPTQDLRSLLVDAHVSIQAEALRNTEFKARGVNALLSSADIDASAISAEDSCNGPRCLLCRSIAACGPVQAPKYISRR